MIGLRHVRPGLHEEMKRQAIEWSGRHDDKVALIRNDSADARKQFLIDAVGNTEIEQRCVGVTEGINFSPKFPDPAIERVSSDIGSCPNRLI